VQSPGFGGQASGMSVFRTARCPLSLGQEFSQPRGRGPGVGGRGRGPGVGGRGPGVGGRKARFARGFLGPANLRVQGAPDSRPVPFAADAVWIDSPPVVVCRAPAAGSATGCTLRSRVPGAEGPDLRCLGQRGTRGVLARHVCLRLLMDSCANFRSCMSGLFDTFYYKQRRY